ncbi:MAG: hypothetical protein EBU90_04870 [Proteobacteria bacterium]|nr:hypothetical protein [Pseudomonadota bacterium]
MPPEIWIEIFKYLDIRCLSAMACVDRFANTIINEHLYDIIDSSHVISVSDFNLVPGSQATYQRFRYVIDFPTLQYFKYRFSDETIHTFSDIIDFEQLSTYQKLSEDTLNQFHSRISLINLLQNQVLPQELLEHLIAVNYAKLDNSYWHAVCLNQNVSLQFIERYFQHIEWYAVSQNKQVITTDVFNCYQNRLFWPELSKLGISEELVRMFVHKLDPFSWQNIAYSSRLSSQFVRDFWPQLQPSLMVLLVCQELEESLLTEIVEGCDQDKLQDVWNKIANSQPLTEPFICQHIDQLPFRFLIRNTKIKRKVLENVFGKHKRI